MLKNLLVYQFLSRFLRSNQSVNYIAINYENLHHATLQSVYLVTTHLEVTCTYFCSAPTS